MLAYLQISNSLDGAPAAAASRDQIDAIVNNYYVAPSSKPNKRKRKNPCRSQVEPPNDYHEPRVMVVDLYQGERGRKCRNVSVLDVEAVQRDRLARSNDDVDAEGQMRTMTVHRSMMDSDTAHIDNEVELSALEEGLTIY